MQLDLATSVAGVAFYPGVSAVWKYARPRETDFFVARAGEVATVFPTESDRVFDTSDPAVRGIMETFGYS
jgi:hypothetical protein